MPFIMPQVESVILLEERARPSLWHNTSIALRIPSRFCIGSPIPIKTMLSSFPQISSRNINCSTISFASRFRDKPRVPVIQKAHFIAQPAWQDTQAVLRPSRSVSRTVSTIFPSESLICNLIVPSGSLRTFSTLLERSRAVSLS